VGWRNIIDSIESLLRQRADALWLLECYPGTLKDRSKTRLVEGFASYWKLFYTPDLLKAPNCVGTRCWPRFWANDPVFGPHENNNWSRSIFRGGKNSVGPRQESRKAGARITASWSVSARSIVSASAGRPYHAGLGALGDTRAGSAENEGSPNLGQQTIIEEKSESEI